MKKKDCKSDSIQCSDASSKDSLATLGRNNIKVIRLTTRYKTLQGLILGLRPANERRRYFVTTSLIGWAQT